MARVFKKRGKWWIDYRVDGGRRREPVGAASYTLAKEVLAKRLAEVAERKYFPARAANAKLFKEVAEKFWELHGKSLQSKSWECMLRKVNEHFAIKKIGEISAADIQRFYNAIQSRTSTSSANRYLTLLSSLFNKAKAWGDLYGDNPCLMVKKQPEPAHRLRFLSIPEIAALYDAAHPRLSPILVAALHTGMRQGELLGLSWENVNLDQGVIYILKSKSGKPREIPITGKLREVLVALGPRASGSVFRLPHIMLRRYFKKALNNTGIVGFRFHDLRHTFASHFIMRTNDLPALQRLLGHSTPAMTLRYAHLSTAHLALDMAAFEAGMSAKAERRVGTKAGTTTVNPQVESPKNPVGNREIVSSNQG